MTYKKEESTALSCEAVITKKKSRIKAYGDPSSPLAPSKIFLKDGDEFEIELFNPFQTQVLAKISINGTPLSASGLILMPGQRVFLLRFIDPNERFVFKTYEVESTDQTKNAISKNGEVIVQFFHEHIKCFQPNTWIIKEYPLPYYQHYHPYGGYYASPIIGTTINTPFNTLPGSTLLNNSGTFTVNGNQLTATSTSYSNSFGNSTNCSLKGSSDNAPVEAIETGRVAGGAASDQSFSTAYGDFNAWATQTISIKLLPESHKPLEVSEIRNYCSECGTRLKKDTWKFCPSCGEAVK